MSQMRTMVLEYLPIYIWVVFGVNVGKYSIHGAYGCPKRKDQAFRQDWFFYGFMMLIDWSCLTSHAFDSDLKFSFGAFSSRVASTILYNLSKSRIWLKDRIVGNLKGPLVSACIHCIHIAKFPKMSR